MDGVFLRGFGVGIFATRLRWRPKRNRCHEAADPGGRYKSAYLFLANVGPISLKEPRAPDEIHRLTPFFAPAMHDSDSLREDNWKFVLDFVETLGKVVGLWIPGGLLITGATEAAGLLRRNVPRLIARLAEKPTSSTRQLEAGLKSVQIQLAEGDQISKELLLQLNEEAKEIANTLPTPTGSDGGVPTADDLVSFFEIGQSPDVQHLSLSLQAAGSFKALRTQWLPPATLLLGGGFQGQVGLTRLLSGGGWKERLRQRLHSLVAVGADGVLLELLPDRGHFDRDRGLSLALHLLDEQINVVADERIVSSVVPLKLPDPIRLLAGHAELKVPRDIIRGWAAQISAAGTPENALTIYYLRPNDL